MRRGMRRIVFILGIGIVGFLFPAVGKGEKGIDPVLLETLRQYLEAGDVPATMTREERKKFGSALKETGIVLRSPQKAASLLPKTLSLSPESLRLLGNQLFFLGINLSRGRGLLEGISLTSAQRARMIADLGRITAALRPSSSPQAK
ncbi:MAG: hypothetical protein D6812_02095 [Deltaproteobacteria bacterium]|nr:MAG: hypothetical protein D6812_02095 [Deltaproteobacteria bacterium]